MVDLSRLSATYAWGASASPDPARALSPVVGLMLQDAQTFKTLAAASTADAWLKGEESTPDYDQFTAGLFQAFWYGGWHRWTSGSDSARSMARG